MFNSKAWAKENVIDIHTAAARCGLDSSVLRNAIHAGRLNAWKASEESRVWLLFWDEVIAWRETVRKYEK